MHHKRFQLFNVRIWQRMKETISEESFGLLSAGACFWGYNYRYLVQIGFNFKMLEKEKPRKLLTYKTLSQALQYGLNQCPLDYSCHSKVIYTLDDLIDLASQYVSMMSCILSLPFSFRSIVLDSVFQKKSAKTSLAKSAHCSRLLSNSIKALTIS